MIETTMITRTDKTILRDAGPYHLGNVHFNVDNNGATHVTAPPELVERINGNDVKAIEVTVGNLGKKVGPITLRFFNTALPSYPTR